MHFVSWSPEATALLAPHFPAALPLPVRLWAILDGQAPGRILVDDPQQPTCTCVQELAEGTTYLGGFTSAAMLAASITQLRHYQDVIVCLWPGDQMAPLLPPAPDYVGHATDFVGRNATVALTEVMTLPCGYEMRPIDADVVTHLDGFDFDIRMFGGIAQALAATVGYCVMWHGTVVSEAVAGPLARGLAEIGVGTRMDHRRKGLATAVAARVIEVCEQRGFQPLWNAAAQNVASRTVARRLGFETGRTADVYMWSRMGSLFERH